MSSHSYEEEEARNCMHHQIKVHALVALRPDPATELNGNICGVLKGLIFKNNIRYKCIIQ